jgi:arsenate reductase (thioredoxin)
LTLGADQTGLAQDLEVMRHRRLREFEEGDQLAHADLAGVLLEHVDELQARRVAQGLGDVGDSDRLCAVNVGVDDRLTAWIAGGALALRGQLQVDSHPYTDIDSIDVCQCNTSVMATVLFVCRQNAGRSQMSQALFERAAEGRDRALSAGTTPAARVHPEVVEAMRELGIDLSDRTPQRLTPQLAAQADVVVTMGCGDECPFLPGKRYIDWDLTDPAGRPPDEVRSIRDEIDRRVRALVDDLA